MELYLEAMQHPTSPPLEQLQASVLYALLLSEFPHIFTYTLPRPTVFQTYELALSLVPQCIWLGNDVRGRYTSGK
ncbi:hypothetical protein BDY19DRAFT_980716 [Irpex rosettiformis]|uniref:Uncharacterized protein n=1 Tax=Irpex rosettiformis TaxID=378272 RepID=A0ACB8TMA4_9APHY|nr:hypothetical protein BDY19DRAFT_980716 [Irpex rosettiformis]